VRCLQIDGQRNGIRAVLDALHADIIPSSVCLSACRVRADFKCQRVVLLVPAVWQRIVCMPPVSGVYCMGCRLPEETFCLRRSAHAYSAIPLLQLHADVRTIRSKSFASAHSLRFPRVKRVRWDKGPTDIETDESLQARIDANLGSVLSVGASMELAQVSLSMQGLGIRDIP
jgi:hypothetical protein